MAHQNNSQENNNIHNLDHISSLLTPPLTTQDNNQQQQQAIVLIHANNNNNHDDDNNNMELIPSQSISQNSLVSLSSFYSTSSQERQADQLFDKIEDMLCEYMRESNRHYLHCRVLRWSLDDDLTNQFSAVVIINPPTKKR